MDELPHMSLASSSIGLWTIAVISVLYLLLLLGVGSLGRRLTRHHKLSPWVFSFALSIYCTSWAFYGVTAQAASNGWWIPPTYIGSILLFWFGFRLISRIAIASRRYKITSVADFIATRYGHSQLLAILTTVIVLVAIIPYISLQLQAISTSIEALVILQPSQAWYEDTALYVTLWLLVLALVFSSKSAKAHQPNPGLMSAIAFESLVKLLALIAIGFFVCFGIFDGFADVFQKAAHNASVLEFQKQAQPSYVYWIHILLGLLATLCLPRQFHISFVENLKLRQLHHARFVFPAYLLLMSVFTLPVALAGIMLLGPQANVDLVVLQLPLAANRTDLALLAYLGGFSAGTSMIIVATVVLGILITNDLLTPLIYRAQGAQLQGKQRIKVVTLRRFSMLAVLLLGYLYYKLVGSSAGLAGLGLMAFALIAQLAPALIIGLFNPRINRQGALAALCSGFLIWAYFVLWPELARAGFIPSTWLNEALFSLQTTTTTLLGYPFDTLSLGVMLSLTVNTLILFLVSYLTKTRLGEWLESQRFLRHSHQPLSTQGKPTLSVQEVYLLVRRFAGRKEAKRLLKRYHLSEQHFSQNASGALLQAVERSLAAVVGGASMRLLLQASSKHAELPLDTVARFVDEASQVYQFNQGLLLATIDNISLGVSVVDVDLRVIAWNQTYLQMFNYPQGFVDVGRPVEDLLRFNLQQGRAGIELSPLEIDIEVQKRLAYLRQGSSYKFQRQQRDGRVFEMQGNPLPGGGFVTTYNDVSSFIEVQRELEVSNNTLEERVQLRTKELEQTNLALAQAKQKIEEATAAKTRFFAAASHDLMQPFNAAALFCGLIRERSSQNEVKQLASNLNQSLSSAEELLFGILELTKLDAGVIHAQPEEFALADLLEHSAKEAALLAQEKGLAFHYQPSKLGTFSDKKLLKRVLQNLLSNAIRYTHSGKILLGVKRHQGRLRLMVGDTGVGIASDEQERIFEEFRQGKQADQKGLGIGLALSRKISLLLGHPLGFKSIEGAGSLFYIDLPSRLVSAQKKSLVKSTKASFLHKKVLLMDNDAVLLHAVDALLKSWQITVCAVATPADALQAIQRGFAPDLVLFDYHLDHGSTGAAVATELHQHFNVQAPVVIHSADQSPNIRQAVLEAGFHFMLKPLKEAALKRLFQRLLV